MANITQREATVVGPKRLEVGERIRNCSLGLHAETHPL